MSKFPLYIHIGVPKSGTTFLQRVFTENRPLLLERGLLYPSASLRGYGHHDIAFLLRGNYPDWATTQPRTLDELIAALQIEVNAHAGPVLLSSENFYLYPEPERLCQILECANLLENHQPIIIVYLRRQDDAHESWYNQTVKAQGYTHSPQECIDSFHSLWDYEAELQRWAVVFGQENIRVRPYEKLQFNGGELLSDFANQISVSLNGIEISSAKVNTGLNRDILEFQRLVNSLPLEHADRRKFHRELIELTSLTSGTGLFNEAAVLDFATRLEILKRYDEGNVRVAMRYLNSHQLFLESPKDSGGGTRSGLTIDKLARILGWLMVKNSKSS